MAAVARVVVFVQENKTTDYYFPGMAAWGADVQAQGTPLAAPPAFDQPHDRNAFVHYRMGDYAAAPLSIDNDTVIPYYSWLAKTFTFCDHHFGAGTNSTPNHLLTFTGQTPTFRNPPFTGPHPVWDLPTVLRLAERAGKTWGAFPDQNGYPVNLVAELGTASAQPNVHRPGQFASLAHTGTLPDLCYVWSPSGYDEHPPLTPNNPDYIKNGHDLIWSQVDAVVASGEWDQTVFILTWDDWGGYADHVPTPSIVTLPDAIHPNGFQAIGGARIPLIMFGGAVKQGIESEWHSHASIAKTAMDLLGLPALGVPPVDAAPSLAGRVDPALTRPTPPSLGSMIVQPPAPRPTPQLVGPAPWAGPLNQPMPPIELNGGTTIPPPTDGTVHPNPPNQPLALSALLHSTPAKRARVKGVVGTTKKARATPSRSKKRAPARRGAATKAPAKKTPKRVAKTTSKKVDKQSAAKKRTPAQARRRTAL